MLSEEFVHLKNICDVANIVYVRIISLHGELIPSNVRTLMYCYIQIHIFVLRLSNYSEIFKKLAGYENCFRNVYDDELYHSPISYHISCQFLILMTLRQLPYFLLFPSRNKLQALYPIQISKYHDILVFVIIGRCNNISILNI